MDAYTDNAPKSAPCKWLEKDEQLYLLEIYDGRLVRKRVSKDGSPTIGFQVSYEHKDNVTWTDILGYGEEYGVVKVDEIVLFGEEEDAKELLEKYEEINYDEKYAPKSQAKMVGLLGAPDRNIEAENEVKRLGRPLVGEKVAPKMTDNERKVIKCNT